MLAEAGIDPDGTIIVRLRVPPDALRHLDHDVFEAIVGQIRWTLEPFHWRDLRVQTWDPLTRQFVPLAAFLPEVPAPRKETVLSGEETAPFSPAYVGQPPGAVISHSTCLTAPFVSQKLGLLQYVFRCNLLFIRRVSILTE